MGFPNFKLKQGGEEPQKKQFRGLSTSISFPNHRSPAPNRTATITKLIKLGSTHPLLCNVIAFGTSWLISTILITQLLTRCTDWYPKSYYVDSVLHNNATMFLKNWLLGGIFVRDKVTWGNLPLELWGEIGKRLVSRMDILSFRSVCKSWRSSLPFSRFPIQVPMPPNGDPEFRNSSYFVAETTIYSYKIYEEGLIHYEDVGEGHMIYSPSNKPFNVNHQHSMDSSTSRTFRLPSSQLSFVSKFYRLRFTRPLFDPQINRCIGKWKYINYNSFVRNTVLISTNADGVNPSYARASDLILVTHLRWGLMKEGRLAMLRLGGPPENWVWDTEFCTQVFTEITTFKGQVCGMDECGRVFLMDNNSLEMTELCPPSSDVSCMERKLLFEAYGDLYVYNLSSKYPMDKLKLSLKLRKWIKFEDSSQKVYYYMDKFSAMF